ncbi:YhgE/Pip domain-containing protein [Microbacterium resistens]|uniref:YhgE/Pip domain-containing protein n=1 Tax=Microbacterium resistens TaxID=156977 RepID=UPI001C5975E7|nr:YhgE/Pip domain-containing protein [Microbacterium resistens]MBW1639779.1 YhgE/Pip domain-containing protein [Microbacterium resistens]
MTIRTPNAWSVFRRDAGRLARQSKAWIIILGVIVTPSLYAWFNIVAFWDPYSNTQHVSVAIVNEDEGATSELTGDIDVGGELVAQLKENDQLGWEFVDEDEAMDAVRSGRSYAAIVIPADFSRDFVSITTGDFTRPELQYFVNEKANAIAPKITDVGASTLDTQINGTFVSVVAEAVTTQLKNAGEDAEHRLGDARDTTVTALDDAVGKVGTARQRITELSSGLTDAQGRLDDAAATLGDIDATLGEVQDAVAQAQSIAAEAQQELFTVTDRVTSAYVSGATLLADASAKMNASIAKLAAGLQQANVAVGTAIDDLTAVVDANAKALAELQEILEETDPGSDAAKRLTAAIDALQERNAGDRALLDQLTQLNADVSTTIASVQSAADAVDAAVGTAATSAVPIRDALRQSVPALNHAMSALSASADAFSSALGAQRTQVVQAQSLLGNLKGQLAATTAALASLDGNLATAQSGLGGVRADVLALSAADVWNRLGTLTGLDADQISRFMASPVEVHENVVFPTAAYGSAMAALFTNLSLWIGAFVLMVIMRLEVDTEGVEGVSVRQAYLGRWMLLASIAVFQAVLVCVGNLVIGVQTANAFAFVGTGVLIGLAYLSIIYALSVCFGYVGKGLCILLVIFQIPGASGLYPIEMMPDFFRGLYPFLPFTYGIDALRETISGFYGGHYWRFLGALAVFVVLAFVLGLFLRRRLGNFALLFNRRLAESQLLVSEDVQITGRRRTPEIIRALTDGDGYRAEVAVRARRFTDRYPTLLRLTLIVGAGVMAVLGVIAWLVPDAKALMLGLWALWCLILIAFLVTLEYVRQSIQQAAEIGEMPEAELRDALVAESARDTLLLPVGAAAAGGTAAALDVPAGEHRASARDEPAEAEEEPAEGTAVLDALFADGADTDAEAPADDDAETGTDAKSVPSPDPDPPATTPIAAPADTAEQETEEIGTPEDAVPGREDGEETR